MTMKIFYAVSLFSLASAQQFNLGTDSLEVYNFESDVTVDADCMYTMTVKMSHPESFPIGDPVTNPLHCAPGELASDGLPWLANRWFYQVFNDYEKQATGLDHLSIDWNACGHPGPSGLASGFMTPHYDFHFYTQTVDYRLNKMVCDIQSPTPVCLGPDQQSSEIGRAMFVSDERDIPIDYDIELEAVIYMGTHVMATADEPAFGEWNEPVYIVCTHDGTVAAVEPMLPLHFSIGDTDHFWENSVTYKDQQIPTLPTYMTADYDGTTKITTITLQGKSAVCQPEFNDLKAGELNLDEDEDDKTSASNVLGVAVGFIVAVAAYFF